MIAVRDSFDLSILDSGTPARVIAVVRCGHDRAVQSLSCDQVGILMEFRFKLAAAAGGMGQRPTAEQLSEFGQTLFRFIVQKNVQRIYSRLPNSFIRVHIFSNQPDLQALPWEYIQQPDDAPGPNSLRSIVRIVPTIGVDLPTPTKLGKAVRILFVYSDPIDQDAVGWLDIKESIEREFQSYLPKNFKLHIVEGATRQSLFNALAEESYDVLHFAGHGEVARDGTGHLLLLNLRTNKRDPVPAAELGMLLRDTRLRLVVLGACSTSAGDFGKEFSVVAQTLVASGIPAVVANQFPITNSTAAKFAGAFYNELLRTGDVDRATVRGRVSLAFGPTAGKSANIEWGIPTLYRHVGAPILFRK